MLNRILNSQTKTITFAAVLLAISALISRILGLVRDRLLAARFGAGPELDVYFAAFQIPDLVYGILIYGGMAAVFLPMFAEYFEKDSQKGWKFANQMLNCFFVLLVVFCGILFIFTPEIINLIVPGFSDAQKALTISATRIMFLSAILFGLASVFSGILQYFNRFLVQSIAPLLYNLGIIFGILFLLPRFGFFGVVWGVLLGAGLFLFVQIPPALKCGYSYKPLFDFRAPEIIRAFKAMIPRTIARVSYQLNLLIATAIASTLAVGSITIFNFANNLQHLAIGIIGISFGTASFPAFSRAWAMGDKEKFREDFSSVFRQILFLVVPISFGMFLLRTQFVQLIFGAGRFGSDEINLTAAVLGLFSFGIVGASVVPLFLRAFFSFQDTKTPSVISLIFVALNVVLCFLFVWICGFANFFQRTFAGFLGLGGSENIAVIGLALAFSISVTIQFILLFIFMLKRIDDFNMNQISTSFQKIVLASVLMSVVVYFILQIPLPFISGAFARILFQTGLAVSAAVIVYFSAAFLLKLPELRTIWSSVFKR